MNRITIITAIVAFALSFFVSLIAGAGFPAILLRPLAFGALFSLLVWIAGRLIAKFVPELTHKNRGEEPYGGINITVGAENNKKNVEFSENAQMGLDQIEDSEYNEKLDEESSGSMGGFSSAVIEEQDATFSMEENPGNNPVADRTKAADMAKAVQTLLKLEE
jgi:hypothetical protein